MSPRRRGGRSRAGRAGSRGAQGARGGALTVRITGIERLRGRLEELPDEVKVALRRAVAESAEAVRDDTRAAVPVDTGHLRRSVDIRYRDEGMTARVGWFEPNSYYANFVEFGTRRVPARPSLGPALEAERTRYRARLTEAVRRALR